MKVALPIENYYVAKTMIRRMTFKTDKFSSKFRLAWNAIFFLPETRLMIYFELSITRLKNKTNRLKNKQNKRTNIDENHPDKVGYIYLVREVEQQIEDFNPTMH